MKIILFALIIYCYIQSILTTFECYDIKTNCTECQSYTNVCNWCTTNVAQGCINSTLMPECQALGGIWGNCTAISSGTQCYLYTNYTTCCMDPGCIWCIGKGNGSCMSSSGASEICVFFGGNITDCPTVTTGNAPVVVSASEAGTIAGAVLGTLFGLVLILLVVLFVLYYFKILKLPKSLRLAKSLQLQELGDYREMLEHRPYELINQSLDSLIVFSSIEFDDPKKVVGQGCFGVVYQGKYNGEMVAVKEINGNIVDPSQIESFIKEAQVMKSLPKHPNILNFVGISAEPFCIITEFMAEGDLLRYLKVHDDIKEVQKLKWMLHVARGMEQLAKQNIIHRDLAARNCLLDSELTAKISDFGLARIADTNTHIYSKSNVGPLKWMSVEALKNKKYSEKSDVWSFGITCVEIITQNRPYPNLDAVEAATQVIEGLRPTLAPKTNPKLQELLKRCWETDPNDRPTFSEIIPVLESL